MNVRDPGGQLQIFKAEFFKALAHPVRIRILEILVRGERSVHELQEALGIDQPTVSQQLAVLRRTSMVVSQRRDGEVVYSISVPEVRDLLLAARRILSGLIAVQGELGEELADATRA